jgi:hypothetical protein
MISSGCLVSYRDRGGGFRLSFRDERIDRTVRLQGWDVRRCE